MVFSKYLNSHRIFKGLAKALIRLHVCAGWSEALLVSHTSFLETTCRGSINLPLRTPISREKKKLCWRLIKSLNAGRIPDFCCLLFFFKFNFFQKIISGIQSECQTVWNRIRPICQAQCGSKLSANVISRWQKSPLARKKLKTDSFFFLCMQSVWTQIRLFSMEQSDLGSHCLLLTLRKIQHQTTQVVDGCMDQLKLDSNYCFLIRILLLANIRCTDNHQFAN